MLVLCVMMNNPKCIPDVIELLKAEMFHNINNQYIFHAILNLYDRDQQIDLGAVFIELQRVGDFDVSNNGVYLSEIYTMASAGMNISQHVSYIHD